jgi:hypothetical protein
MKKDNAKNRDPNQVRKEPTGNGRVQTESRGIACRVAFEHQTAQETDRSGHGEHGCARGLAG